MILDEGIGGLVGSAKRLPKPVVNNHSIILHMALLSLYFVVRYLTMVEKETIIYAASFVVNEERMICCEVAERDAWTGADLHAAD